MATGYISDYVQDSITALVFCNNWGTTYTYVHFYKYPSSNPNEFVGKIYLKFENTSWYAFYTSGQFDMRIDFYDENDNYLSQSFVQNLQGQTILKDHVIYHPAEGWTLWANRQYYAWMTSLNGSHTAPPYAVVNYSYGDLDSYLSGQGYSKWYSDLWFSREPFGIRYASDNGSQVYTPRSAYNSPQISAINIARNGGDDIDFKFTIPQNAAYFRVHIYASTSAGYNTNYAFPTQAQAKSNPTFMLDTSTNVYFKQNNTWSKIAKLKKKINGTWEKVNGYKNTSGTWNKF